MIDIPYNRTKIVCTIGPASDSKEVLKDLILAGMDVARLNFSHGSHEVHKRTIESVREINKELGTHVAILADLQGPKIRVGKMDEPFPVKKGDTVIFDCRLEDGREGNVLPIQYETFAADVNEGDMVLVDDGKVELLVRKLTERIGLNLRLTMEKKLTAEKE